MIEGILVRGGTCGFHLHIIRSRLHNVVGNASSGDSPVAGCGIQFRSDGHGFQRSCPILLIDRHLHRIGQIGENEVVTAFGFDIDLIIIHLVRIADPFDFLAVVVGRRSGEPGFPEILLAPIQSDLNEFLVIGRAEDIVGPVVLIADILAVELGVIGKFGLHVKIVIRGLGRGRGDLDIIDPGFQIQFVGEESVVSPLACRGVETRRGTHRRIVLPAGGRHLLEDHQLGRIGKSIQGETVVPRLSNLKLADIHRVIVPDVFILGQLGDTFLGGIHNNLVVLDIRCAGSRIIPVPGSSCIRGEDLFHVDLIGGIQAAGGIGGFHRDIIRRRSIRCIQESIESEVGAPRGSLRSCNSRRGFLLSVFIINPDDGAVGNAADRDIVDSVSLLQLNLVRIQSIAVADPCFVSSHENVSCAFIGNIPGLLHGKGGDTFFGKDIVVIGQMAFKRFGSHLKIVVGIPIGGSTGGLDFHIIRLILVQQNSFQKSGGFPGHGARGIGRSHRDFLQDGFHIHASGIRTDCHDTQSHRIGQSGNLKIISSGRIRDDLEIINIVVQSDPVVFRQETAVGIGICLCKRLGSVQSSVQIILMLCRGDLVAGILRRGCTGRGDDQLIVDSRFQFINSRDCRGNILPVLLGGSRGYASDRAPGIQIHQFERERVFHIADPEIIFPAFIHTERKVIRVVTIANPSVGRDDG